ncbi:flippase [Caballeronia sp. BR00000012568055]|uniref:flippase n=1 Tax=Caballeronia sp. BR00000012568055 TaxID=2918761 RepID=UPI0023F7CBAB|nr:flippase [Caballeronia sp. BR00000012568055]
MRRLLLKNVLALSTLQAANMLLPLVTLPYLLRVLGPDHFGAYVFAQALVTYLVLLVDYGFNLSATGHIARAQNDLNAISKIFWTTQIAKAVIALAALVFLIIGIIWIPKFIEIRPILLATFPIVIGAILFPQWLFQGLERMSIVTISMLSARFLLVPLTFFLVRSPEDTWIAALINSMTMVSAGLIAVFLLAKNRLVVFVLPSRGEVIEAYRDGWHVFISTAAVSLYTTANSIILGFLVGNVAVGYFGAADKIRNAAEGAFGPLANAVYPRVSALFHENIDQAYALVRKVLLIQSGAMLVVSLVLFACADWIVRLAMGPQYEAAVVVLRWMAFIPFLVSLSNVFGIQLMLPLGMKKKFSEILVVSGVFNLITLIPLALAYGAQGAAMSVLATELLVTIYMAIHLINQKIPVLTPRTSIDP